MHRCNGELREVKADETRIEIGHVVKGAIERLLVERADFGAQGLEQCRAVIRPTEEVVYKLRECRDLLRGESNKEDILQALVSGSADRKHTDQKYFVQRAAATEDAGRDE